MLDYEAIVVGGGHAGIEAALALSRLEFKTILITQNIDTIGKMSCNPAIGGLAKGNMVREIDALGGEMANLIDQTIIQFRILNRSRGPAVQAPRAQADRHHYANIARATLERQKNLSIYQDTVNNLLLAQDGTCIGVKTERANEIRAQVTIITTGTFMDGKVFIGEYSAPGGRLGEPPVLGLGDIFRQLGYVTGRLKTGTPPRVKKSSIDFTKMEEQVADEHAQTFSFRSQNIKRPSLPCYINFTNEKVHKIIRANLEKSPLFSGEIVGTGPRYCPSIEDKLLRFPDRTRHQIFIEPEGIDTEETYLNGVSTSLPEAVQWQFIRAIPGLEHAEIMRPGYAVEYDFVQPTQLFASLETKRNPNLYLAGQINGTSGYEEAACQGLLAGINAAMKLRKQDSIIIDRSMAYLGVLIDDLVTLGTEEPYRMFTSRAEYRLSLRHGDADVRLLELAKKINLLPKSAQQLIDKKRAGLAEIQELFRKRSLSWDELAKLGIQDTKIENKNLYNILKKPELDMDNLQASISELSSYPELWVEHAALDVKYEGYIKRQAREISRFRRIENIKIPEDYDWETVLGLSNETKRKLAELRPHSLGQASRVSGIRPSDIALLMVLLKKNAS